MAFFTGGAKDVMRTMTLMKRRQQEHERIEEKKRRIEKENQMRAIDDKFKTHCDTAEENLLKSDTIGLMTLEDMKKKQQVVAESLKTDSLLAGEQKKNSPAQIARQQHMQKCRLSFACEEFDDFKEHPTSQGFGNADNNVHCKTREISCKIRRRFGKNPDVDTSFLPDRDREEEEKLIREQLKAEWLKRQEEIKAEEFEVMFSFWDGSGHPRSITMRKGCTVQQFLYKALETLRSESCFIELKCASVDQMMYVKDDVILPHHHTFYELITTQARGRHGHLLFAPPSRQSQQQCLDDLVIRKTNEPTVKGESHAGKVVLRNWYERNKHIFPACRWEPFDPERKPFSGSATLSGSSDFE